ncbi:MAG TPA: hypothetical protein VIM65_19845 [Cyclobacteriaceae bacterium]
MEIFLVIIASVFIPIVVILGVLWLGRKFKAQQKEKDKLVDTLEEIIDLQSDSIKRLK